MVINARNYADFKLLASSLRRLDFVCYNNSANIAGSAYGVAYAFDYEAGNCVCVQTTTSFSFSTTDFPTAVAISDHLEVAAQSVLSNNF